MQTAVVAFTALGFTPQAGWAQEGFFQPVIRVGDQVVTGYELQQRTLFLSLIGAGPVDETEQIARQQLENEAFQRLAAAREGVVVAPEQIEALQSDFAAQGDFSREDFISRLAERGVAENTFRELVSTGLAWRDTVRARFLPLAEPTDAQVEAALAGGSVPAGTRVSIAEIILPAGDPATAAASRARANELRQTTDIDTFANFARIYSGAPSRFQGGDLGWRPLTVLPEAAALELARIAPGQVTTPVELAGTSIAIFQLRDRQTVAEGRIPTTGVDYAEYLIPGGRSPAALAEAARIRDAVGTCDDLYGIAKGQPPERLSRLSTPMSAVPAATRAALATLDPNEVSTELARGGNLVFLMLCERTLRDSADVDRLLVRNALTVQRLEGFAAGYLAELRASIPVEILR